MPSRESQELRHWLKARQARSGLPRCRVELSKPAVTITNPRIKATSAAPRPGALPLAHISPSQSHSPYPAPEKLVKKMTAKEGCISGSGRGRASAAGG